MIHNSCFMLISFIVLMLLSLIVPIAALAHGISVTPYKILEVEEPSLAPGDFFYFVKKIGWSARRAFTFDPIKKAELDLSRTDEALAEVYKVADAGSAKALAQALANYRASHERLLIRLESLKGKNKNSAGLVAKMLNRMLDHEASFSAMQDDLGSGNQEKLRQSAAKTLRKASELDKDAFSVKLREVVQIPTQYASYMTFAKVESSIEQLGKAVEQEIAEKRQKDDEAACGKKPGNRRDNEWICVNGQWKLLSIAPNPLPANPSRP